MASVHVCDGCGKPEDSPVVLGRTVPRDYCAECAVSARKFMEAEEELRKYMHEHFIDERAMLIANLSVGTFKLPDVP
jgi:hypothetical protein